MAGMPAKFSMKPSLPPKTKEIRPDTQKAIATVSDSVAHKSAAPRSSGYGLHGPSLTESAALAFWMPSSMRRLRDEHCNAKAESVGAYYIVPPASYYTRVSAGSVPEVPRGCRGRAKVPLSNERDAEGHGVDQWYLALR
jgi:hypothetical protein